jgi:ribosome-associated translation inhibitor RaiA
LSQNKRKFFGQPAEFVMQTPPRITFRHLDRSEAMEHRVRELVHRLERYCDRITGCHVVIEGPGGRPHHHGPITVKLELIVPGGAVNASNAPLDATHNDAYVALRDAFEAARRQLVEFAAVY